MPAQEKQWPLGLLVVSAVISIILSVIHFFVISGLNDEPWILCIYLFVAATFVYSKFNSAGNLTPYSLFFTGMWVPWLLHIAAVHFEYVDGNSRAINIFGYLFSLILTTVVIGYILLISLNALKKDGSDIVEVARSHPPGGVCALLGLFMIAIVSLSFLLSFHHRLNHHSILFNENTPSTLVGGHVVAADDSEGQAEPSDQKDEDDSTANIFFVEGSIRVGTRAQCVAERNLSTREQEAAAPLEIDDCYACKDDGEGENGDGIKRMLHCINEVELNKIVDFIRAPSQRDVRLRVRLFGHASDSQPKSGTNYEYSEARTMQVRQEIETRLTEESLDAGEDSEPSAWVPNIEWFPVPVAELGDTFVVDIDKNIEQALPDGHDYDKLRVEISVDRVDGHVSQKQIDYYEKDSGPRPILDYVYFMVYTTTTTGYGDIVPIGPIPKLITIVGNFLEVIFLVVFFGALLSRCFVPSEDPMLSASSEAPKSSADPEEAGQGEDSQ